MLLFEGEVQADEEKYQSALQSKKKAAAVGANLSNVKVTLTKLRAKERHFNCIHCLSYILNLHMFLPCCEQKSKAGQKDVREGL